jgi:hypothetical protein
MKPLLTRTDTSAPLLGQTVPHARHAHDGPQHGLDDFDGIDYVHHPLRGLPEAWYRATYPVKREKTKRGATHNAAVEEPPSLTVRA